MLLHNGGKSCILGAIQTGKLVFQSRFQQESTLKMFRESKQTGDPV